MIKMKRQKAKWSAVLTSAAMLMINIPVSAEEQSQYMFLIRVPIVIILLG